MDETLGELRQEIDLNVDGPGSPASAPRPAEPSACATHEPAGASHSLAATRPGLPVLEEDDYLALAADGAEAEAGSSSFGWEDYLREGGG